MMVLCPNCWKVHDTITPFAAVEWNRAFACPKCSQELFPHIVHCNDCPCEGSDSDEDFEPEGSEESITEEYIPSSVE